jgi:menaquinone reductase, multiheme cytochrome c subunit
MRRNSLVFGLGLAATLVAGWVVFPRVLYVQRQQPVDFLHKTHAEKSGIADCSECHALREDGAFAGIPAMEKCAGCHSERIGESKAEATLVDNFIKTGHETPWLVYARQPANVWFARDPLEARGIGLCGMPFNLRQVGPGARV